MAQVPSGHVAPHARTEDSRVAFSQNNSQLLAPPFENRRLDYVLFELPFPTVFLRELLGPSLEFFHELSSHSALGFKVDRNPHSFFSRGIVWGETPLAVLSLFSLSDCSSCFIGFGISPA